MSIVIGIDYSVNCPSICILRDDTGLELGWWVNYRKDGPSYPELPGYVPKGWTEETWKFKTVNWTHSITKDEISRFIELRDWTINTINYNLPIVPDIIAIEDYSFGAKGNSLTHLAENMGILKAGLHDAFKFYTKIHLIAPTAMKKHATGSGRADKDGIWNAFINRFPQYAKWQTLCHPKAVNVGSPCADIADSFFLADYGRTFLPKS